MIVPSAMPVIEKLSVPAISPAASGTRFTGLAKSIAFSIQIFAPSSPIIPYVDEVPAECRHRDLLGIRGDRTLVSAAVRLYGAVLTKRTHPVRQMPRISITCRA